MVSRPISRGGVGDLGRWGVLLFSVLVAYGGCDCGITGWFDSAPVSRGGV